MQSPDVGSDSPDGSRTRARRGARLIGGWTVSRRVCSASEFLGFTYRLIEPICKSLGCFCCAARLCIQGNGVQKNIHLLPDQSRSCPVGGSRENRFLLRHQGHVGTEHQASLQCSQQQCSRCTGWAVRAGHVNFAVKNQSHAKSPFYN
jgi:hypothetical protein